MTLDDLRFWLQMIHDSKRTILCPPDLESRVKGMVDAHGLSGMITVRAHPYIPENQMFIVDEQAIQGRAEQADQVGLEVHDIEKRPPPLLEQRRGPRHPT